MIAYLPLFILIISFSLKYKKYIPDLSLKCGAYPNRLLQRSTDILLTGRTVDAAEADKIGLISRLVDEEKLMEVALEIAAAMLDKTPLGLQFTKEVLNQNRHAPSLESAIELENRNQSILCITPEFFKAVEKFGQRKKSK
jgi:enoyl-CoA hydratase